MPAVTASPQTVRRMRKFRTTAGCTLLAGFNPDEPRDKDGKWTAGPGNYGVHLGPPNQINLKRLATLPGRNTFGRYLGHKFDQQNSSKMAVVVPPQNEAPPKVSPTRVIRDADPAVTSLDRKLPAGFAGDRYAKYVAEAVKPDWLKTPGGHAVIPSYFPAGVTKLTDVPVPAGQSVLTPRESKLASLINQTPERTVSPRGNVNTVYLHTFSDGTKAKWKPQSGEADLQYRDNITPGTDGLRERAAWEVAKLVGMDDMVPAVIQTNFSPYADKEKEPGALLEYAEGSLAAEAPFSDRYDGDKDRDRAAVYDYVIGNEDRHNGNWLVDNGKLKLIDHGLSFPDAGKFGYFPDMRHHLFMWHASRNSSSVPSEYAAPYTENRKEIRRVLLGIGIPDTAVKGVMRRITALSKMTSWKTIGRIATKNRYEY